MKVKALESFYCVALGGKVIKGKTYSFMPIPGKDDKQAAEINKSRAAKLVEAKQVEIAK